MSQATRLIALVALCLVLCVPAPADQVVLTLATTTSTENSGLLAHIHPDFERRTGIKLKVIAKGTGASLQLARDGNADVVLVHARELEDAFVAEGFGVGRRDVMYNDFVIVGPAADPAGVGGGGDAVAALRRIATGKHLFVSRGDRSGTHHKEQTLWAETGLELVEKEQVVVRKGQRLSLEMLRPQGDWYHSVGQGMGKTLIYATEKQAYTLSDRGTYYAFAAGDEPRTDLEILVEGDERLHNPYGVIAVNPERFPHVNHDAALRYIEWLTSPQTQARIGHYRKGGKLLFHPALGADSPQDPGS